MVRINLIEPNKLSDQHLIAEYDEILMLTAYIKKYPEIKEIPPKYCLGEGHMKFFKDKLKYIKNRHDSLRKEMKKRNFKAQVILDIRDFKKENKKDWKPDNKDLKIIKERITTKLKLKPNYYRYNKEYKQLDFFLKLLK